MKLGVTIRRRANSGSNGAYSEIPSAHCSQCDRVVERCRHVVPYYDADRYAACGCRTHEHRNTRDRCIMVEYLANGKPGKMVPDVGLGRTRWSWPNGRPMVRCLNCGDEWLEPMQGEYISARSAQQRVKCG